MGMLAGALQTSGAVLVAAAAHGYEEPRFEVVRTTGEFEMREYAPQLVAETQVDGEFNRARREAFRRLFDYISGGNEDTAAVPMTAPVTSQSQGRKIAMTVPVTSTLEGRSHVMRFTLPSTFTPATAPKPRDPRVRLVQVEARLVAVRSFSGRSSEANFLENQQALLEALRASGIEPAGTPLFAVYDAPWTPWFMRHNEVLVEVELPRHVRMG